MQETTITLDKDNKIPIVKYIAPYWTVHHMLNKEMAENGPIDLEYNYINQNKRIGKEIDKENKKLPRNTALSTMMKTSNQKRRERMRNSSIWIRRLKK